MKNIKKIVMISVLNLTLLSGCVAEIKNAANNIKTGNYTDLIGNVANIGSDILDNSDKFEGFFNNNTTNNSNSKTLDETLNGIEANLTQIQQLSDNGNPKAQGLLGLYTQYRVKNMNKAMDLYSKSCNGGFKTSCQQIELIK